MSKKVSVVIPVFNRPEELKRAVASVMQQTMQDLEIIIVDDCSSDNATLLAADACLRQNPEKIRLLKLPQNCGVSAARNAGIKAATGEYLALLDCDDEWLPQKLEKQLAVVAQQPCSQNLVCLCNLDVVEKNSGHKTGTYRFSSHGDLRMRMIGLNILNPCSVMLLARATFDRVGLFDEQMRVSEDVDWLLRHLLSGGRVVSTPESLSIYRSEHAKTYHKSDEMLRLIGRRYSKAIREQFGLRAYREFISGIHYHQLRGAKRRNSLGLALFHLAMVGISPLRLYEIISAAMQEQLQKRNLLCLPIRR